MKITIKNGESVENALKYLQDFLSERKNEYPILAGNLNVYVTMKGFGNLLCPENEKEYELTRDGVIDVEQSRVLATKEPALVSWGNYVAAQRKKFREALSAVQLDKQYLNTAEEKNRKSDAVEKRKKQLEKNQTELAEIEAQVSLVMKLHALIQENKIRWYFLKKVNRKTPYTYEISPFMIFENVDGETWHFASYESRYGTPYGSLRKGLPNEYKE